MTNLGGNRGGESLEARRSAAKRPREERITIGCIAAIHMEVRLTGSARPGESVRLGELQREQKTSL